MAVVIDVVNLEERGTLTVRPDTANVDVELTATLTDGDTATNPIWTWQRSDDGNSGWADISGANSATYTVVDADEGKHLRVRVVYTDNISAGKTIITKLTGAVGPSTTRSGDNSLGALALSGLTLSPAFQSSSNRNEYTATATYPTTVTTITATASDANAAFALLDGDDNAIVDADSVATGTQMALAIGENTLKVRVTAHNTSVRTYTVTLTRAKPTVSIEPPSGSPTESDGDVTYTVRRSPAAVDALVLSVSVSESGGDMIEDGTREVTIPAGATSVAFVELDVPIAEDDAWENHSTVTATIAADDHYTISTGNGEAVVTVMDDDFPVAEAVLEVPDSVGEDDSIVATVTVITERDEQPHRDATSVYLHTRAGTAGTSDFVALTNDTGEVTLEVGDFDRVDLDDDPGDQVHVWRYRRVHQVTIETSHDDVREDEETFTVFMARYGPDDSPSTVSDPLTLNAPSNLQTVTISANDQPTIATLRGITLSAGALTEAISDGKTDYTASVPFANEQITVTPVLTDGDASWEAFDSSDTRLAASSGSFDVDLALGANTFEVEVTAQDGDTQLTYTVVATRAHPELTFTAAQTEVDEGDDMTLTITRNGTTSETTAFTLTVTPPTGSAVLVADADGVKNLTIGSGQGSVTHTVGTVDDDAWEAHADVEVTVAADAPITINGAAAHTVQVQDDDFPAAVARLSVAPNPVNEDGTNPMVTATVTITTTKHEQPHTSSGTILLSTRPDTAGAADFTALTPTTGAIAMAAGDFEEVDTDPDPNVEDMRWSHSKSVDIPITDDTDKEDDEQFTVSMAKVTTGSTPTEPPITLDSTATMRLVTISQSDRSTDNSLSALAVENGDLTPGFDAGRLEYTATVAFGHEQVTVTPTKNNEFATIKVLDGDEANEVELDDDAVADGYQVDLGVNDASAGQDRDHGGGGHAIRGCTKSRSRGNCRC